MKEEFINKRKKIQKIQKKIKKNCKKVDQNEVMSGLLCRGPL